MAASPRKARAGKDHGAALEKAWERYQEAAKAALAADRTAISEQLGAHCNAHNELVAEALAPAA